MAQASYRQIARELGVSVATVSRALHRDPRVKPETAARVQAALRANGYELDPVISTALSRVRQRNVYRETIAWCSNVPPAKQPWLKELFEAAHDFAGPLGYRLEHFQCKSTEPRELARLRRVWISRGIRGVLLGPFVSFQEELTFGWEELAWVVIGHSFLHPHLHQVGRDYAADIREGLAWLEGQGCQRPAFICRPLDSWYMEPLMHLAGLEFYDRSAQRMAKPLLPFGDMDFRRLERWLRANRPDGMVLSSSALGQDPRMRERLGGMPVVLMSSPRIPSPQAQCCFWPRYKVMGRAAVNLMHRLVRNRELGMPEYKQSVLVTSRMETQANAAL